MNNVNLEVFLFGSGLGDEVEGEGRFVGTALPEGRPTQMRRRLRPQGDERRAQDRQVGVLVGQCLDRGLSSAYRAARIQ